MTKLSSFWVRIGITLAIVCIIAAVTSAMLFWLPDGNEGESSPSMASTPGVPTNLTVPVPGETEQMQPSIPRSQPVATAVATASVSPARDSTTTLPPAAGKLPSEDPDLYRAIWRGSIDEMRNLIAAGADVNAKDADGDPLLYTAVWTDNSEALKILIDAGADVNAKDADGDPLLYTAVWREIPEVARLLIDAGADVNARDSDGDPLLHSAVWRGHVDMD